jgi:CRISPR-associated protein Csb1
MTVLAQFDHLLSDSGPAAIVLREQLMPVDGADGVIFPPTFAAGDDFPGGYNIDTDASGRTVAIIDTVGAQANRLEPLFKTEQLKHLVPQIVIRAGDQEVNLLDAGHRAGDAIVRCSSLKERIDSAFRQSVRGDVSELASISPTSLVFGVWNSRGESGTQDKRPRLISSVIRAFDIRVLTRHAQYNPALDYSALEVFSEVEKQKSEGNPKSPLAQRGFVHVPVGKKESTHGGLIASGGIRRDVIFGLVALRLLRAGRNDAMSRTLQRYILGLSLVAITHPFTTFLRQGCILVQNPDRKSENEFVYAMSNGTRTPCEFTYEHALEYATAVAKEFGVGESHTVPFDKERARRDVQSANEKKQAKGSRAKGKKAVNTTPDADGTSDEQ